MFEQRVPFGGRWPNTEGLQGLFSLDASGWDLRGALAVPAAKERCVWRHEFETLDQAREVIAAYITRYKKRPPKSRPGD